MIMTQDLQLELEKLSKMNEAHYQQQHHQTQTQQQQRPIYQNRFYSPPPPAPAPYNARPNQLNNQQQQQFTYSQQAMNRRILSLHHQSPVQQPTPNNVVNVMDMSTTSVTIQAENYEHNGNGGNNEELDAHD